MTRSHRALLISLLSLLLLGMQHEALRHALAHWGPTFAGDQKQSLRVTVSVACDECTLLAAGANGVTDASQSLAIVVSAPAAVAHASPVRALPAPVYYEAQAPPLLFLSVA
jgi:hypothetical protein